MTKKSELLPKERVRLAVEHIQPDRPPIRVYLTPEISRQLSEHFGGRNLNEVLGVDFRGVGPRGLKSAKKPKPGSGIDRYDMWAWASGTSDTPQGRILRLYICRLGI